MEIEPTIYTAIARLSGSRKAANSFYSPMSKLVRISREQIICLFSCHRNTTNLKMVTFDQSFVLSQILLNKTYR